jgi:hypothetical protein
MKQVIRIFALTMLAYFCCKAAQAQTQLHLRMFADRNGDLFWMDTKSVIVDADGKVGVTVYIVKGGYPSERQQVSAACCGRTVATRAPEGRPVSLQFDCSGSNAYTVDRSEPRQAAPLTVPYNIAQFACAAARCKLRGMVCSD